MPKESEDKYRCGFVAIIGRPNVGKSTLLNNILGQKVAIVTKLPQTTRNLIRGILTEKRGQVIFVDTPGIHLSKDRLDKYMNISASEVIAGADIIVHLVDSSENVGQEEAMVVDRLKTCKKNIILGLNKIDLGGEFVSEYIKLWEDAKRKPITELGDYITIVPLSGLKGKNIKDLLDVIFSQLPEGQALYPADMVSDVPKHNMIADIIREKLMNVLRQEVPYSLAVYVEEVIERSKRLMVIKAQVFIERDSQRKIVIGENARLIKQAGVLARQELEKIFGKKIYLDLHVETKKDWREDPQMLQILGYSPQ